MSLSGSAIWKQTWLKPQAGSAGVSSERTGRSRLRRAPRTSHPSPGYTTPVLGRCSLSLAAWTTRCSWWPVWLSGYRKFGVLNFSCRCYIQYLVMWIQRAWPIVIYQDFIPVLRSFLYITAFYSELVFIVVSVVLEWPVEEAIALVQE